MKVIVVSNTCSDEMYKKLQDIKYSEKISPQQNYFSMLIGGLIEQPNTDVVCVTARSIAENNTKVKELSFFSEKISDNLAFVYTKVKSGNRTRNITNYLQTRRVLKSILEKNNSVECVAIIDPLSFDITSAALSILRNVKKIALVTDIPMYIYAIGKEKESFAGKIKSRIKNLLFMKSINKFDGYCYLTESMNCLNKFKKPYCIIEGMVPVSEEIVERQDVQSKKRVILYAGGLYEKFGIKNLVEAAKLVDGKKFELHLYGEGNCITYINDVNNDYPHIKYMGVLDSVGIREVETKASALINPRPNEEEFTRFSFPSKTLEYMNTGRPVWTTRLSGIPDEYFNYINVIEDSSIDKIRVALETIINLTEEELDFMGQRSRAFARNNKCATIQAKKLLNYINSLV